MRRLAVLIAELPPDSALVRALNPKWAWHTEHELLAQLVEMTHAAHFKPPHLTVPRPGDEPAADAALATPAEIRAFFSR